MTSETYGQHQDRVGMLVIEAKGVYFGNKLRAADVNAADQAMVLSAIVRYPIYGNGQPLLTLLEDGRRLFHCN